MNNKKYSENKEFLESFLKIDLYNKSEVEKFRNEFIKKGIIPNLKNLDIFEIFDNTEGRSIFLMKYKSKSIMIFLEEFLKLKYGIIRDDY